MPNLLNPGCLSETVATQSVLGTYYLFLILNGDSNMQRVSIPPFQGQLHWYRVIDTSLPSGEDFLDAGAEIQLDPADFYLVNPRSTVVLLGR